MNAAFSTDGKTMTHSAFSSRSCGMLSGISNTSCMTVPEFSKRSCSLFAANAELATNKMQTPRVKLRNIENLHYLLLVDELRSVPNFPEGLCIECPAGQPAHWKPFSNLCRKQCYAFCFAPMMSKAAPPNTANPPTIGGRGTR